MPVNSVTVPQSAKRRLGEMPNAISAPKKKRDFFNGSQGLDFRDFKSPEPQEVRHEALIPEGAYAVDERRATGPYPQTPPVGVAFPSSPDIGHPSSEFYASCHGRRSHPVSYQRLGEEERCPPITSFHIHSHGLEYDDSAPLAEAPAPFPPTGAAERPLFPRPATNVPPSSDGDGDGDDGKKKAKKRKQRCRLCANHGIYVEIKGHKWYCPYRNPQHTCVKCEITRQRQYFMAEQQKLTREQQQQQLHMPGGLEGGAEGNRQATVPVRLPAKPSDFPRMQELLEETDHILDEDLFRQIDECVRPKVTHH